MGEPEPSSDILFARLVVEQGLAKPEQVEECRRIRSQLVAAGVAPAPKLGELLVKKGYLSAGQCERTLRLSQSAPATRRPTLAESPKADLPPEAAQGQPLGKYLKTKKLGAGGMGEVWKAWDTELRRWVALKFLKGSDEEEIARFRREAQTAAKLTHPNIGAVYEANDELVVSEAGGVRRVEPFIAMQFVDGQTLESFPRDDPKTLAEIVRQAALAVQFAHEQGVIHRDLKPANIMVVGGNKAPTTRRVPGVPSAPKVQAYVMDFGLAKSTNLDSKLSVSGTILGTPAYMSPEQARGSSRTDSRTDVYSLGATLYELLANRPPFRDENVYDLLKKVIEEDPKRLGGDLGTIAMKCLEKDPARRYATALELAEDLTRWQAGEAILAHPPSTLYTIRKFAVRRKAVVAVAGIAVAVLGISAAIFIPHWLAARREALAATEARRLADLARERQAAEVRELELNVYPMVEHAKEQVRSAQEMLFRPDCRYEAWKSRLDAAEQSCREAIGRHPAYAPAYLVLGLIESERGRFDQAIEAFTAAIGRNETYDLAYLERAKAYAERVFRIENETLAQDAVPEAAKVDAETARRDLTRMKLEGLQREERNLAELLLRMLADGPRGVKDRAAQSIADGACDERAWRIAGEAEHRCRRFRSAAECYDSYVKIRRGDGRGWNRLSHMLTDAQDYDPALEAAKRAVELNPGSAEAHNDRGLARRAKGDLDGALADYDRAIEINPNFALAYNDRGVVRRAKGDGKGAMADFDKAIELNPKYEQAYWNRAEGRRIQGDLDGAIADFGKAIEFYPTSSAMYFARGKTRYSKGDFDGAIADCGKAIELDPKHVDALNLRGVALEHKGDFDGAIAEYDRALKINPKSAETYANRGLARRRKKDVDGSIADCTQAIELNPKLREAYANRGLAREDKGDLDGAISDFDEGLKINPGDEDLVFYRGLARKSKGDLDGAIADFEKAKRADWRWADAYNRRGTSRSSKGDYDGAIADHTKAFEIDPNFAEAPYNRGNARRAKGDLDGALQDYTKALDINKKFAEAYANRGLVRQMQGNLDGAIADLEKALEVASADWSYRKMVEQRLATFRQAQKK